METVKLDMNALDTEKYTVITVYKKQLEAFRYLKKEIERAEWADENYDRLIDSMNLIGKALSASLQALTNGQDVLLISDLMPMASKYMENATRFPRIKG